MTNGTVGQIAGSDGRTLTVKYKEGEKSIVVPRTCRWCSSSPARWPSSPRGRMS